MKTSSLSILIFATAGLLLAGCGDSEKKPYKSSTEPGGNPITAPVDYLGALGKAKQSAEKTVDVVQVNQAVMYFQEAESRLPNDLNELVAKHYLHEIPKAPYGMKIVYNATDGSVKVVKQ